MLVYVRSSFRKLKKSKGPSTKRSPRPFVEKKPAGPEPFRAPSHSHISSLGVDRIGPVNAPSSVQYEGEMADREAAAQLQIERQKKCVAPAYNKGAYTLIASPEQATWIGRK